MPETGFPRCPRIFQAHGVDVQCPRPQSPGGNRWCLECRAAYQREYQKNKFEIATRKAFALGVQRMRAACLDTFRHIGPDEMSGYTAYELVLKLDVPMDL